MRTFCEACRRVGSGIGTHHGVAQETVLYVGLRESRSISKNTCTSEIYIYAIYIYPFSFTLFQITAKSGPELLLGGCLLPARMGLCLLDV